MTARIPTQRRRFLRNFALGSAVVSGSSLFPLRAMADMDEGVVLSSKKLVSLS
jgi:hypothetical protein